MISSMITKNEIDIERKSLKKKNDNKTNKENVSK